MMNDDDFISAMEDHAEEITRMSDPETIQTYKDNDLPVPSKTKEELADEKATIVTDYWKEVMAASGAGLTPESEDAGHEALKQALMLLSGSGSFLSRIQSLFSVCKAWWDAVAFRVGNPIGAIVSDTDVQIIKPTDAEMAATAAPQIQTITVEDPAEGEAKIEPAVRASRAAAKQQAEKIWIPYGRQITTTHTGPNPLGVTTVVPEQAVA